MKVALVHDYLNRLGGAERVLSVLAEMWPDAPIFTSVADREVLSAYPNLLKRTIKTSFLQRVPLRSVFSKISVPFIPYTFENINLDEFDLIVSSGYFAKGVLTKPYQVHINYCNTPPRFLYNYGTESKLRELFWGRIFTFPVDHKLRSWDFCSAQRPDYIIANSENVARRVRKFWRRKAKVIYPPVELPQDFPSDDGLRARWKDLNGNFFLVVSRLEPYKNVELAVRACNNLEVPLKVAGTGSELKNLKKLAGPTVEIMGRVTDADLSLLYGGCKALIAPARDEDFGLTPVEAMSYGKPVVAYKSGGFRETVISGKTGIFFEELSVESLVEALQKVDSFYCREDDCFSRAQNFSKKRFRREIDDFTGKACGNLDN